MQKNKLSQKAAETFLLWILINLYFEPKLIFLLIHLFHLLVHHLNLLLLF